MLNGLGMYEVLFILIASLFLIDIKKVARLIKWFRDLKVKWSNLQRDIEDQIADHLDETPQVASGPKALATGAVALSPVPRELPPPVLFEKGEQERLTAQLIHHISNWDLYLSVDAIGGFMPLKNEPDLTPLYQELLDAGKELYLPRVESDDSVRFVVVSDLEMLENGPFGRKQPPAPESERGFQRSLDCILIPGLFFSEAYMRMSHRKDFYANLLSVTIPTKRVGVGFAPQLVEELPRAHEGSLHMDILVTNSGITQRESKL
ncbi:MAG: hypothetical protein OCD01_09685 [Fibrobacterales bacterium]